jgi:glycosyltransferase involved in cell wall biosynthesis
MGKAEVIPMAEAREIPVRVFHVLATGPPATSGYSLRSVFQLLAQKRIGLEVAACLAPKHSIDLYGRWGSPPEDVLERDGVQFFPFDPKPYSFLNRLRARMVAAPLVTGSRIYWSQIQRLYRAHAEKLEGMLPFRPDCIVVHSPALLTGFGFDLAKRLGVPAVFDIHGVIEETTAHNRGARYRNSRQYRIMRDADTEAAKRSAHCFVICESLRAEYKERGISPVKMTVVPNAVDRDLFETVPERDQALAQRLGLCGAEVLGSITSMVDYEGLGLILKAVKILRGGGRNAKGLIVGDGKPRSDLSALARRLGVEDHVVFTGRVPHADIPRHIVLMDVFATPRVKCRVCELVTPLKPFEAMALGVPIIVSDLPALREIVGNGERGALFPAGDAQALADRFAGWMDSPEEARRIGAQARAWVLRERTWDILARKQEGALQGLTG